MRANEPSDTVLPLPWKLKRLADASLLPKDGCSLQPIEQRVPLDKVESVVKRYSTSAVRQYRPLANFVEDESHGRSGSYHRPVELTSFHPPSIRPRRVP